MLTQTAIPLFIFKSKGSVESSMQLLKENEYIMDTNYRVSTDLENLELSRNSRYASESQRIHHKISKVREK